MWLECRNEMGGGGARKQGSDPVCSYHVNSVLQPEELGCGSCLQKAEVLESLNHSGLLA